jgi:ATP-dependent exoDNAse (exonuclease V) beta subunit
LTPPVHHLPYAFSDGEEHPAGEARALEATALAAYLRHLNAHAGIRWGDIAVLALVTTNVHYLSRALDDHHVPHSMAGGTLFTTDPLHRQFVLGLRAIADRNDGVAEAALFRAPFFAIDLLDLVRDKMNTGEVAAQRGAAARAWLRETRRRRFERTPGQTARALLEETGIGRTAALGPNGEQRLRHLRELCLQLEVDAAALGLDFDGITARMRTWIEHPIQLDPPRPVGSDALQILTVHQAKGLEFPVVVLWDGMGLWPSQDSTKPWQIDRDGNGWSLKTNDVAWEEPADAGRLERERRYADAERKRLVYVAATRARDLLIIPKPAWPQAPEKYIHAHLLADPDPALVHTVETFVHATGATWSPPPIALVTPTSALDVKHLTQWSSLADEARRPRSAPRSVTGIAKAPAVAIALRVGDVDLPAPPRPTRTSRHGPVFGEVVHEAIGRVLKRGVTVQAAVATAAHANKLTEHLDDAVADVERAIMALRDAEILGDAATVRVEYPIAFARDGGLVSGYIDLLAATAAGLVVVDFKTDAPPAAGAAIDQTFPSYVAQVRTYAEVAGAKRAALLFTATGDVPLAVESWWRSGW